MGSRQTAVLAALRKGTPAVHPLNRDELSRRLVAAGETWASDQSALGRVLRTLERKGLTRLLPERWMLCPEYVVERADGSLCGHFHTTVEAAQACASGTVYEWAPGENGEIGFEVD